MDLEHQDLRSEIAATLIALGIPCLSLATTRWPRVVRARSACALDTLLNMADKLVTFKYVVKNVGKAFGKTITFMPKPLFEDTGRACTLPVAVEGRRSAHSETGYAGLSDIGRWYIGGLLAHAAAICAFSNPTTNSYKRLVPGYEAPVNLVYSQRNRSASCRIPLAEKSPKSKRVEFRCPDSSSNAYLAF